LKSASIKLSLFFLIFLASVQFSDAQNRLIKGVVVDATDQSPLPFVQIGISNSPQLGCISDIDGKFELEVPPTADSLDIRYTAYQNKRIPIPSTKERLYISLKAKDIQIDEVVVIAGENPAYRIIRKSIKNRKQNNPERLSSFSYQSYNKAILFDQSNAPKEVLFEEIIADSSDQKLPFYYMLMESVSERYYKLPNKDEEIILASRISGLQNPSFAALATDFQPFAFYRTQLSILDKNYLNPISPGSIRQYEYRLEDTLYRGADSIFIISFFPRKGKVFDALKGVLYIHTNGYAVQNVLAEPADPGLMNLKFEQQYEFLEGKQWFPTQLNFELKFKSANDAFFNLQGKSYLSKIQIQPDLSKHSFGIDNVVMQKQATQKADSMLQQHRPESLNAKEERTYLFIDSLGRQARFDEIMKIAEGAPFGLIYVGPLAYDLKRFLDFNPFEGLRLGAGLYTSPKVSEHFRIGGYFGYGFRDRAWKYGGDLLLKIHKKSDLNLGIIYQNDIREPAPIFGSLPWANQNLSPPASFARRYLLPRMDYQERLQLSLQFRMFRYLQVRPFTQAMRLSPAYEYQFLNAENNWQKDIQLLEAGVQLRWTWKEQYADFNGYRTISEQRFPVLFLQYQQGIHAPRFGQEVYKKLQLGLDYNVSIPHLGQMSLALRAGWTDRPLHYSLLFNGQGSYDDLIGIYNANSFQTMDVTEFVSNQFIYGFWMHNFGRLPIKSKDFRPELKLSQAVGFGQLFEAQRHHLIELQTMEKGFFESGIILDNLVRYELMNVAYAGLSLGWFYRYGPYALDGVLNNSAFKVNLNLSF
jgi:hypothetical protein